MTFHHDIIAIKEITANIADFLILSITSLMVSIRPKKENKAIANILIQF